MRRPAHLSAALAGACCLAWAASAPAQVIDYGNLEELFGEPVTASATGTPQRASLVPADMEIITAEDIRRSGADNLPDILRMVPGVDVRRYGFAAANVSIRGYNRPGNPRLLVLLNGQQVYFDDLGRTQWSSLPVELDEIRQIEVVKGPNSALYGFNAASGVINIVTWDPLRDKVNAVTARGGTQEYGALSAVGTARFGDRGGVRVSAGGFRARNFAYGSLDPLTQALQVSPRRGSISADGRLRIAPGVEATLSGSVVDLRTFEPVSTPIYTASQYRTNSVRAGLTAETGIGTLGLQVYHNYLDYAYRSAVQEASIANRVTVAQASYVAKLGASHAVRLGLEFRDNVLNVPSGASRVGYRLYAGSLTWEWQVAPQLSLTNAVRVDHLALNHSGPLLLPGPDRTESAYDGRRITDVSFNSGVVWRATDDDTLRLTLARGLQAPSLIAFGYQDVAPTQQPQFPLVFIGSPSLDPSVTYNAELGYDREVRTLASTVRTAVFAQRTDNVISDPFTARGVAGPQGVVFRSANVGRSAALGGEVGVRGAAEGWRWNASYAYISVSDRLDDGGPLPLLDFKRGTPAHVVILGGGRTWGRFEVDVQGRWQSRYRDYGFDARSSAYAPVDVPNYVQFNARVGYKLTDNLTLALTADQFNVSRLRQTGGPPVERRLFLSATARF